MLRSLILYPLLGLVAAALVWQSLQFAPKPLAPAPQEGLLEAAEFSFTPAMLAEIQPAPNQDAYVARDDKGTPLGLRLAIRAGEGQPRPDETGAVLMIQPESGARFAGLPATVTVVTRPLLYPTAPELAVSLQTVDGALPWVVQKTAVVDGRIVFAFPPPPGPLTGIALRPVNAADGDAIAIEIAEIRASFAAPPAPEIAPAPPALAPL
jgi:hypothetical protein